MSESIWRLLTIDTIVQIDDDATELLRRHRIRDDEPIDARALAIAVTGRPPRVAMIEPEAKLVCDGYGREIVLRSGLLPTRARWLTCHEVAEYHHEEIGYREADREARCDAMGAALIAPRRLVLATVRQYGHSVYSIAHAIGITQSTALLRIGEVEMRSVALVRRLEVTVRGAPHDWPSAAELVASVKRPRADIHPVRIIDEPARWGFMRRRTR